VGATRLPLTARSEVLTVLESLRRTPTRTLIVSHRE
jgi:hypothetical protein